MEHNMEQIYPSIWVFKSAFTNPEYIYESVEKFIDNNLSFNWVWAQTSKPNPSSSVQDSHRTNKTFSISGNLAIPEIKELDDLVFMGTTQLVAQYATFYELGSLTDEGYSILKYENGTMYKKHHDCGANHSDRVVSMLIYLNDGFVGGELEFPYLGVTYTPSAGDVIFFPSNYTFSHIAHPVVEGTKYCVVSWLRYGN